MDAFVKAYAGAGLEACVPVLDRLDVLNDFACNAAFFTRLPYRGYFRVLSFVDETFGQLPAMLSADGDDDHFGLTVLLAEHDSASGRLIADRKLHCRRFTRPGTAGCARCHLSLAAP